MAHPMRRAAKEEEDQLATELRRGEKNQCKSCVRGGREKETPTYYDTTLEIINLYSH
jgi:hypothetical protein